MRIPTFKFHGSKCMIAKYIFVDLDFPINNYYEPFAGRGNAFFYFASNYPYSKAFLNDKYTAYFLIALRDYKGNFDFVPEYINRNIYEKFYNMQSCFERDLAESFCAYNGTFWGAGANWTNSPGHPSTNRHSREHTIVRFKSAKQLLQSVEITSIDYVEFLNKPFGVDDLIYCDPPYFGMSESSRVGPNIDHEKLASLLLRIPCKVILSGYDTPLYDRILKSFNKFSFERASCARNSGGGSFKAIEQVWRNF